MAVVALLPFTRRLVLLVLTGKIRHWRLTVTLNLEFLATFATVRLSLISGLLCRTHRVFL